MRALIAVASAGCAQLLGIDTTSGPNIDAPGPGAHVTIQRVSIGATIVTAPLDQTQTGDTVTFLVPDGAGGYTKMPGIATSSGIWQADIESGNPLVDFTALGNRYLWAFPTRDLHVAATELQHPDPDAPAAGATLVMNVTIPAYDPASQAFYLEAIGAWSYHPFAAGELPSAADTTITSSLPYAGFALFDPTSTLRRITASDQVVLLRYLGSQLTAVYQAAPFDQTDSNTLTGTMTDITSDRTVTATVAPTTLATRYTAVRPAVTGLAMSWGVYAAPGFVKGSGAGPQLVAGSVAMTDTSISQDYANPFTSLGWSDQFVYSTSESRTLAGPNGQTVAVSAGLQTVGPPTASMTLDLPAGLPQTISLEQMPLTSDNMTITLDPTKYTHVQILADHATNTLFEAAVDEVVPDMTTMTASLVRVVDSLTNDPANLVLPPDAFKAGHTYVIEAACHQGGFPNVATGDLATTTPPFHVGYAYSGSFTVEN